MPRTYLLPSENLEALTRIVSAYRARAARAAEQAAAAGHTLAAPPAIGCQVIREVAGADGPYVEVQISLPESLSGYVFVAVVDHARDGDAYRNHVRALPGVDAAIPAAYETAAPLCDHCRTRRRRSATYLAFHPTDGLMQVGSSCLEELTGVAGAEALLLFAGSLDATMERLATRRRRRRGGTLGDVVSALVTEPVAPFLARVVAARRIAGRFLSVRRAADEGLVPTWQQALLDETARAVTDADRTDADRIIAWARALVPADEFQQKAQRAVAADVFDIRLRSLVAALVVACPPAQPRPARPISQALGVVGQPLASVVTVVAARPSQFSPTRGLTRTTTWHLLRDDAGNTLIWRASSVTLDEGSRYHIAGTVKGHEPERRGPGTVTILTRCSFTPEAVAPVLVQEAA